MFEAATVVLTALGVFLIGAILFTNLTPKQQNTLAGSITFLDIHEQAFEELQTIQFVSSIPHDYFQQFYIAFTQVATLSDADLAYWQAASEQVGMAYSDFLQFSDQMAINYNGMNQPDRIASAASPAVQGAVAGATVTNSNFLSPPPDLPRVYHPPEVDWRQIGTAINQINNYLK